MRAIISACVVTLLFTATAQAQTGVPGGYVRTQGGFMVPVPGPPQGPPYVDCQDILIPRALTKKRKTTKILIAPTNRRLRGVRMQKKSLIPGPTSARLPQRRLRTSNLRTRNNVTRPSTNRTRAEGFSVAVSQRAKIGVGS